jgi:hypothetical protein
MGANPRILIIYRGEATVNYQNSGAFPVGWLDKPAYYSYDVTSLLGPGKSLAIKA